MRETSPARSFRGAFAALVASILAAMLAPPHHAHADVRPALEVFLAGTPRAAQAGRTYAGTIEFRAGSALSLDSLRLGGERWRIARFRPRLPHAMPAGGTWRVSFRAVPADARRPLVLTLRIGPDRWSKEFDLSPEAIARARGPAGVSSHPPR